MNYANTITKNGVETIAVILPLSAVPLFNPDKPPQPNTYGVPDEVQVGWVKDGDVFVPPPPAPEPPPPTREQLIARYEGAVRYRLDSFARTRGYDSILAACTYVTSDYTQFKLEAEYCVYARDNMWKQFYMLINAAGDELPTLEELMEALPNLDWPE